HRALRARARGGSRGARRPHLRDPRLERPQRASRPARALDRRLLRDSLRLAEARLLHLPAPTRGGGPERSPPPRGPLLPPPRPPRPRPPPHREARAPRRRGDGARGDAGDPPPALRPPRRVAPPPRLPRLLRAAGPLRPPLPRRLQRREPGGPFGAARDG